MKNLKLIYLILVLIFGLVSQASAQTLRWTSFDHLTDSLRVRPKPIVIFIYTDWCKYCELMKQNTFANRQVIKALNEGFYLLALQAEDQESITFLNRTYTFDYSGNETGTHQLATFLGKKNGILSYPTTVFISPTLQRLGTHPNFLSDKELLAILNTIQKN